MHWGVVNEDKSSGETRSKAKWLAVPKPRQKTKAEQHQRILKDQEKLVEKFSPPDPKTGLSSRQKKAVAYGLAGALVVATIVGSAYYAKSGGSPSLPNLHLENYKKATERSTLNAIGADFITKESFDRPAFTLPAGHKFFRMSSGVEKEFGHVTYTAHSVDDFNRYVARLGHTFNHKVTFQTKAPLKVPSLTTVLDTFHEVMSHGTSQEVSRETTLTAYRELVGGKWNDSHSLDLFTALKNKGYHAIVDEMDAGVISESPLVIFDHSLLTKKATQIMSLSDIRKAESLVRDFANRK
jgi:hypothetical protein